jgi:hypothetical protein
MKRIIPISLLCFFAICPFTTAQEKSKEQPPQPVTITKLQLVPTHLEQKIGSRNGQYEEQARIVVWFRNDDSARSVATVDIQMDIIDSLRRTVKERLYFSLNYKNTGTKLIAPNKTGPFYKDFGEYKAPEACLTASPIQGVISQDSPCCGPVKINGVTFSDGSGWERPGWRDEPNPNKQ